MELLKLKMNNKMKNIKINYIGMFLKCQTNKNITNKNENLLEKNVNSINTQIVYYNPIP